METRVERSGNSSLLLSWILAVMLFSAISLQHTPVSGVASYAITLAVYILSIGIFLWKFENTIEVERIYLVLFLLFLASVFVSTMRTPTIEGISRIGALFVFTTVNLFILPRIISFDHFLGVASRFGATMVVIGFLPYAGYSGDGTIVDLSLWGANLYWYPDLSPITSIYVNPNALGFLLVVGAAAALFEWRTYGTSISKVLLGINTLGLLFTNYRTGWVVFVIVLCLYMLYIARGRKWMIAATFGGIITMAITLLMMFNFIPGPTVLTELSLNNRRSLWISAVEVFRERYVFGYGLGNVPEVTHNPHNAYIRMFVALGIVGGTIHLAFFITTVIRSVQRVTSDHSAILAMLLVAFFIDQMMNQLSFVGISIHSTVIALVIGYHATVQVDRN